MRGETLWRCTSCGKWSHARRRPKHHQRFIESVSEGSATAQGLTVLRVEEEYTTEYDYRPGGVFVACGPFSEWRATPR